MKETTIFTGYPSATATFLNYAGPVTLKLTSGDIIPSSAIIHDVKFSFYGDIWKGVEDNFHVYDLTSASEPKNNGNYWIDSVDVPRISDATKIDASDGNLLGRYEFTGVKSSSNEYGNYDALRILVKNTTSLTICFCRRKYRNPKTSTGSTGKVYSANPYYCEVTWEDTNYIPTAPSDVKFVNNSVNPGGLLTLNWTPSTLPSGASNKLIGYTVNVYSNNDHNNSEISGDYGPEEAIYPYYLTGANLSSYTFAAPLIAGTYYARVDAVVRDDEGSVNWCTNSTTYVPFTVKQVTNTGAPSNLQINYKSNQEYKSAITLYIGTMNIPELKLTWDAAPNGINNNVDYYYLHQNNSLWADYIKATEFILPSATNSADDFVGNYSAYAQSAVIGYNSSDHSNTVSIEKISAIPTISFTRSYSGTINSDLILTWNAASAINNATATYYIYRNNESSPLGYTTSTSFTFDINDATAGSNFNLSVEPRYVTANGSYTPGTKITTGSLVRASSFDVPNDFWISCYDGSNGFGDNGIMYSHAHESISIRWSAIESNANNGNSFTYILQQQINGGAFSEIATYNNASSFTQDISSFAEGTTIGYRMKITNNYGITTYSSTHTVTKIIRPKITKLLVNNITANKLDCVFDWEYGSLTASEDTAGLNYIIELEYNETPFILVNNGKINQFTSSRVIEDNCDISISTLRKTLTSLYNDVITNKKVYPKGKINLYLSQGSFASAKAEQSVEFTFNYVTAPSKLGEISYISGKSYYNPGDTVQIQLNNFAWSDAAGGTAGGEVSHYLTSSYSTNKFIFTNNKATVTAPNASEDLSINLTLKTSIKYAEVTKEYVSTSVLPALKVARWTAESVLIDSLNLIENKTNNTSYLEGYVRLPERLCSSQSQPNLTTIVPAVISPSTNYTITFYNKNGTVDNSFITSDIPANYLIRFTISNSEQNYSNVTAQFKFTFTNSSNKTLIIDTNPYRYFTSEIDLAVRKNRIGINVGNDFGTEADTAKSALLINAGSQTGTNPIVEILSTNSSTTNNKTQFLLLQDGSKSSAIWSDGESIFIDNLKVAVEGLTASRVLISNASGKLTTSSITTTKLGYLTDVTSNIQAQLNNKQETISGAATTITSNNLTASRALISNSSGKIADSAVTSTELGYLSGVTSSIQTQINDKYTLPNNATKNYVLAAPSSANGTPSFRALVSADIPSLNASKITAGTLAVARGGTASGTKGAAEGGALYNLGLVYSASGTGGVSSPQAGMICLVPKG